MVGGGIDDEARQYMRRAEFSRWVQRYVAETVATEIEGMGGDGRG